MPSEIMHCEVLAHAWHVFAQQTCSSPPAVHVRFYRVAAWKALKTPKCGPATSVYLMDLHEVQENTGPDDYVIQKRRQLSDANLRGRMYRLCIKAGVERWPKIFQNLRSTRQTTLEQFYPRGTVCAWMGNTEDIAEAHYVQELEEFRIEAAKTPTTDVGCGVELKLHPDKKVRKV
ncbi:MAG: hypothetical protein ABGZ53_25920, partial [Fuerstiella sp.]